MWLIIMKNILTLTIALSAIVIFATILEASDNFTVNYNTNQSITAFSTCKNVTNNSGTLKNVYIPTQSSAEWTSFYSNPPSGVTIGSCGPVTTQVIFLTSGSTWTVPADWNPSNNSIEVIGGGGNGAAGLINFTSGYGGGGGAYSAISNVTLTPGAAVAYSVGGAGGDSYFCNSTLNCTSIAGSAVLAGARGGVSNAGGSAGAGVGTVKYSGGNGGAQINGGGGGGGGGAAGPHGPGAAGGTANTGWGGAGGGGANSGTAGVSGTNTTSGFTGGAGGSKRAASQTGGGGGNGSKYGWQIPGNPGTQDVVWTQTSNGATAGPGGGGGGGGLGGSRGGSAGAPGGSGSAYGGGGGGGGGALNGPPGGAGGPGVQGIIVITYGP